MKNVSMKIGFVVIFAAAVLAGCSGKKTAAGGHEKVTIKFPTASASGEDRFCERVESSVERRHRQPQSDRRRRVASVDRRELELLSKL